MLLTVKEPEANPPEIEHTGATPPGPAHGAGVPAVIVQTVSSGLNPVPATPTGWPCCTEAGFRTTRAVGVPTVKKPVAAEPVLSSMRMPYVPDSAVEPAVTEPATWPIPGDM